MTIYLLPDDLVDATLAKLGLSYVFQHRLSRVCWAFALSVRRSRRVLQACTSLPARATG